MTIFNKENTAYETAEYPLFLGQRTALYDSVNTIYPELFEAYKEQKSIDWSEDEVDLTQSRMDLQKCPRGARDIMTLTLAYQWELDSVAAKSIAPLFAPFVTNSELWAMLMKQSEIEVLHALTYSEIIRQCYDDPKEVFEMVMKNQQVLDRGNKVVETFEELAKMGAKYTLDLVDDRKEILRVILKAYTALYALEKVEFMSSFACTFALAEQDWFVGIARLVQKICNDELVHAIKMDQAVWRILKKDPEIQEILAEPEMKQAQKDILDEVTRAELTWNKYLFQEDRKIVGLNQILLDEQVLYNAQGVYDFLEVPYEFNRIPEIPLPWLNDWLDIDLLQVAAQEASVTSYRMQSVISTLDDDEELEF